MLSEDVESLFDAASRRVTADSHAHIYNGPRFSPSAYTNAPLCLGRGGLRKRVVNEDD